jgi:esterase/lipase superfamily enzyme
MNQEQINAAADGWALFETNVGLRIQKDDESERFENDDAVLTYLLDSAERGGVFEAAALAYHFASIAGLAVDSSGVIDAAQNLLDVYDLRGFGLADEAQALEDALSRL